ncbi:hypothetical protein Tco_0697800 [Tanacetum coccineum]
MGIVKTIIENNDSPPQDKANANIFLRKHIDDGLKFEYLTTKDPSIMWKDLKDRFDNQKEVLLPAVREEWRSLQFQDFKKVNEYSSALFRICSQLKFCGQSVTDTDMLEKTYYAFHASNMTLQQQYRLHKFTRYFELNAYHLVAEQNNEILMKNHQSRLTRSLAYREVNATKYDTKSFMRGQGQIYTHGRGFTRVSGQRTNNNAPRNNKAKNVGKHKHNGESGLSQNTDGSCFRCGSSNHWAKSCRTASHPCEMYQASLEEKEREVNLVDQVDLETMTWIYQTSSVVTQN